MEAPPQPDIPDPASPTPETPPPMPGAVGAADNRSRIRSRPVANTAARLPGTYAANYGGDMNWRRGLAWLWVLFGLAVLGEITNGAFYLLAGYSGWPRYYDTARIVIGALVFLTLWIGLGWTRWVLVATDFLFGIWLILWAIASHVSTRMPPGTVLSGPMPDTAIEALPKLALGVLYLGTAGYLALSTDVIAFVRHRREGGRGWVVAPVTILITVYLAVVFTLEIPYGIWIGAQLRAAKRFGGDTVRTMTARWAPDALVDRADESFLEKWPEKYRRDAFYSLATLGMLQKFEAEIIPMHTAVHPRTGWFTMQYTYNVPQARFEHGTTDISILIVRPLFGRWQIDDMAIGDTRFDESFEAKPAATPVPSPVP